MGRGLNRFPSSAITIADFSTSQRVLVSMLIVFELTAARELSYDAWKGQRERIAQEWAAIRWGVGLLSSCWAIVGLLSSCWAVEQPLNCWAVEQLLSSCWAVEQLLGCWAAVELLGWAAVEQLLGCWAAVELLEYYPLWWPHQEAEARGHVLTSWSGLHCKLPIYPMWDCRWPCQSHVLCVLIWTQLFTKIWLQEGWGFFFEWR